MTIPRNCSFPDGSIGTAVFSDDERHRYLLTRTAPMLPGLGPQGFPLFLMLNPSTATHEASDPTVTRCAGFARRLGYRSFRVCNLFSLRATKPKELLHDDTAEGDPENLATILVTAARAEIIICAWGTLGELRHRRLTVTNALREREAAKLRCLGRNRDGSPRHPLYLPGNTPIEGFLGLDIASMIAGAPAEDDEPRHCYYCGFHGKTSDANAEFAYCNSCDTRDVPISAKVCPKCGKDALVMACPECGHAFQLPEEPDAGLEMSA